MATRSKQIIGAFDAFNDPLPNGEASLQDAEEIPFAKRIF
jgi:hypothetical protein